MTDKTLMHPDDHLLIDHLAGQLSDSEDQRVRERIASDAEFARRAKKIGSMMDLMHCCGAPEPEQSLIDKTLAAVAATPTTHSLLGREAVADRPVGRATFSLKEVGAMAALLFVVASILLPSFRNAGALARERTCVSQVGSIGTALMQFANDHQGQLPAMSEEDAAWGVDALVQVKRSNSSNLWRLVHGRYARASLFQCPAGDCGGTIDAAQMAMMGDFPSHNYISYSYHNSVNAEPLRADGLGRIADQMAILADRTPVFEGGRFDPRRVGLHNSLNHNQRGQAVLYLDMHASWKQDSNVGVNGDNIWLVQDVYTYQGSERPVDKTDSFLLPSYVEAKR